MVNKVFFFTYHNILEGVIAWKGTQENICLQAV